MQLLYLATEALCKLDFLYVKKSANHHLIAFPQGNQQRYCIPTFLLASWSIVQLTAKVLNDQPSPHQMFLSFSLDTSLDHIRIFQSIKIQILEIFVY